jgi:adenylate cyclase class 2
MMREMGAKGREIEVKLPFSSADEARDRLAELGAVEVRARIFEDNVIYDRAVDPLGPSDRLLRLRRVGNESVLTFKAPVPGDHRHKVRIEHESRVDDGDALAAILDGLGYRIAWRYQKYRTEFELERLSLCLDETALGCFVELEGSPDAIDRTAERLGFDHETWIRGSYRDLAEAHARRRGLPLGDLLVDPPTGDDA